MPLMAVEREENGREGCACACGWREKKREERRGRERESGEHAAKRVIESRARSLLYRPPYAYPVPFPQHPTPYSPFLSLSVSTFPSQTTRHRYFFLSDFSPSVFIFRRSASADTDHRGTEKKEGKKSASVHRPRAKGKFSFSRGKGGGLINIIGYQIPLAAGSY